MRFFFQAFLLSFSLLRAGELPWLGVVLAEATREERSALQLESGVGLSVKRVANEGPYSQALGKKGDVWWKFDGQILTDRCQMFVLLRSKEIGDEIEIEFYRNGDPQAIQVKLAKRPEMRIDGGSRAEGGAHRALLTEKQKVAKLSAQGHEVSLAKNGDRYLFEVQRSGQSLVKLKFTEKASDHQIPQEWREFFNILKLTLAHQSHPVSSQKNQRVRYIPRAQTGAE